MAGRGKAPKPRSERVNSAVAARGEIQHAESVGWQHGKKPAPPSGLMPESRKAWSTWMGSWFAAFWTSADLPGLRRVIMLYDQVERGEFQRSTELRLMMDTYGITPKGQQDRRWQPPKSEASGKPQPKGGAPTPYSHLRAV